MAVNNSFLPEDSNYVISLLAYSDAQIDASIQEYTQQIDSHNQANNLNWSQSWGTFKGIIAAANAQYNNTANSDGTRIKALYIHDRYMAYYLEHGLSDPNKRATVNKLFEQRDARTGKVLPPEHMRNLKNELLETREKLLSENISPQERERLTTRKEQCEQWLQQLYIDNGIRAMNEGLGTSPAIATGLAIMNQNKKGGAPPNTYYLGGYDARPDYYPGSSDLKQEIDLLKRENQNRPLRFKVALGVGGDHMVGADIEISHDANGQEQIKAFVFNSWIPYGNNPTEGRNKQATEALRGALGDNVQFSGNNKQLQDTSKDKNNNPKDMRCGYWTNWFLTNSENYSFNKLTSIEPRVKDARDRIESVKTSDYPKFSSGLERRTQNELREYQGFSPLAANSSSNSQRPSAQQSSPNRQEPSAASSSSTGISFFGRVKQGIESIFDDAPKASAQSNASNAQASTQPSKSTGNARVLMLNGLEPEGLRAQIQAAIQPSSSSAQRSPTPPSASSAQRSPTPPSTSNGQRSPTQPSASNGQGSPIQPSASNGQGSPIQPSASSAQRSPTPPSASNAQRSPTPPSTSSAQRSPTPPSTSSAQRSQTPPSTSNGQRSPTSPSTSNGQRSPTSPSSSTGNRQADPTLLAMIAAAAKAPDPSSNMQPSTSHGSELSIQPSVSPTVDKTERLRQMIREAIEADQSPPPSPRK